MAETFCLTCKETVTLGKNCKCFFHGKNDQQLLPRLQELNNKNADIVANDEYPSTSNDNYNNLCSEFQQIQITDYKNVKSAKYENNEEARISSDLNRTRIFGALNDETRIKGIFQNQSGSSISSSNIIKTDAYSDDFSFKVSTKHYQADPIYKPKTEFCGNWEIKEISTSDFYQQRSCEIDPFNATEQALSNESKMTWHKNNCPSFSLEEKLSQKSSGAFSQGTYLKKDFSAPAKFSVDTNTWPVSKKSDKKENEQLEGNLKESLNVLLVTQQPVHESMRMVDEASKSIESMKAANNAFEPSEGHSDFIISQKMKPINEKTYECDKCKENFFNQRYFIMHYKSHSAKNFRVCRNSQKASSCKNQWKVYKRAQKKLFACNICDKRFTSKSALTTHYRIHTKEKPFVCEKCGKGFTDKSNLFRHLRIHTNEKPFVCNICGKGYTRKDSLHSHYRTHTGEKPYECDVCRKGFSEKFNLISHNRTHTNEMPFECELCKKRFKKRSNLSVHLRTHTGEKPYVCNMCEKRYSHNFSLVAHYRTHTSKKQ